MEKQIKLFGLVLIASFILGCSTFSNSDKDKIPAWDKATLASCWNGANANQRMMNMLSPHMSDAKFDSYLAWMKSRGVNTAHCFVSNKGNGENSKPGYSVYGQDCDWIVDKTHVALMKSRISKIRKSGLAFVPWLFADDSSSFNKVAKSNFDKYLLDIKNEGLLKEASFVVVGLELDEYYNANEVSRLVQATRKVYPGKIGTHQTSGKYSYSVFADICVYQVGPGKSEAWIKAEASRIKKIVNKPLWFFELERFPARSKCEAALAGGAIGVGNW